MIQAEWEGKKEPTFRTFHLEERAGGVVERRGRRDIVLLRIFTFSSLSHISLLVHKDIRTSTAVHA